ncbi:MAG: M60 family metallopeptidase, partial [Rikenellaceae bacterium]
MGNDVNIHIMGGKVNGFFDLSKDDNLRWNSLLDNAVSPVMDIVGKHTQLAYSVESLKREAYGKGVELVNLYDSLITQQHQIMGLVKYNRVQKNHMFGRVIWNGFMYADGIGAAFNDSTMKDIANPDKLRVNSWGVAHEFGHVNQVRPDMKWVGTTEVTNNIYSVWSQYTFNKEMPKLERENLKDYDGKKIGGRITAYMESAFVHRQPWLTQAGNDRWDRQRPRDWGGDHFVKLVPFWQLQLYFAVAGDGNSWGNKDFYGDIFIQAIDNKVPSSQPDSYYQLSFIKRACDVAKLDLTDFFVQSGMLVPIDLWVDDYTCAQMTIKDEDIKAVKEYASKYKKPITPVLQYITANSVEIYKRMLPLKGQKGEGFTKEAERIVINNSDWANAVAFETYAGDKLIKVAFVGAGSIDASHTIVQTPAAATTVKAVGVDGRRLDVI